MLLASACAFVVLEPWHGATVLSLSEQHGVDAADLPALPLIAIALGLVPSGVRSARLGRWWLGGRFAAASALVLGALLLAGLLLPRIGSPLTPAGGGTFGGSTQHVDGVRATPVGRWSHLAVTYDGTKYRLYVDGAEAGGRSASGTILRTADALWIGGNRPYGEYFRGVIDEVRIYGRALGPPEMRAAMSTPVRRHGGRVAAGLAAAYGFGGGRTAVDESGNRNTGTIIGAEWTRAGRFGGGVRFGAAGEVVRVPASHSLDLRQAMTLMAWVRPSESQSGWRTVLARQTDAYFLAAGGGREDAGRLETLDRLRFALVIVLVAWGGVVLARRHTGGRSWYWPLTLFIAGSLVDVGFTASDTLIGPALVAVWCGAGAPHPAERAAMLAIAASFAAVTILALADPAALPLPRDVGGTARTAALGLLLTAGILLRLWRKTEPGTPVGVT